MLLPFLFVFNVLLFNNTNINKCICTQTPKNYIYVREQKLSQLSLCISKCSVLCRAVCTEQPKYHLLYLYSCTLNILSNYLFAILLIVQHRVWNYFLLDTHMRTISSIRWVQLITPLCSMLLIIMLWISVYVFEFESNCFVHLHFCTYSEVCVQMCSW